MENKQIDDIVAMLDSLTGNEVSRIKILTDENKSAEAEPDRVYHHGRCDIASPWACGASFDVLE